MGADQNLDVFGTLAEAVGLTRDGELQGDWFQDPLGNPNGSKRGLSSMMYLDEQREALIAFVDDVLGAPDREEQGSAVWVPLFRDSGATIFVVVDEADNGARVGFGIEYDSGSSLPAISVSAHVPVFQFEREGAGALDISGAQPDWLVLGRDDAHIELAIRVIISNDAPAPGDLFIGAVAVGVDVPTSPADDLEFSLGFERLQLPGTNAPRDFELTVDNINELGSDFLEFMTGLIQAQAEALDTTNPATAPFAALTGLAGLRSVPNIPPFPLESLISNGVSAVTGWIESILSSAPARNAWLGQWAALLGGTVNSGRSAIEFSDGSLAGAAGLRVASSAAGGLIITPWLEGSLRPQAGAEVKAQADLLTLATLDGSIKAVPNLSLLAVFGQAAGMGSPLLAGDPAIGSIKTGITLAAGKPAFALTAHNVTLGGTNHELLDLSSPDAALDAAESLVDGALVSALATLGRPGEICSQLLGLDPPTGISGPSAIELLTDPLGKTAAYWNSLAASPAAMAVVLTSTQELITGNSTSVSGTGTAADPWSIDLDPVALEVSIDGDWVNFDLEARLENTVLDDKRSDVFVSARLLRLNFAAPNAEFLSRINAGTRLREADASDLRLDMGQVDVSARSIGASVVWGASTGFAVRVDAPDLSVEVEAVDASDSSTIEVPLPLPEFSSDGTVRFSPDWGAIENAVAALLRRLGSPIITALTDLVGWNGEGARLSIEQLLSDPEAALKSWMGDLVLNCSNVRVAMSPLSYLFSGFRQWAPLGNGNERTPYRAAIAAAPRAPGVAVWLDPGCDIHRGRYQPPAGNFDSSEPTELASIAQAIRAAGTELPELADLMTGRNRLDEGFQALIDRFTGTDGLIGRPASLPTGVNGIDIEGLSYRELVAFGAINLLPQEAFGSAPDAMVYVGCEDLWSTCFGSDSLDVRGEVSGPGVPGSANGHWSICLPTPATAAAERPDRGAIDEQCQRLIEVLQDRATPITVVAFGSVGAAAIKAASTITAIDRVVTVGSPWAPVSLNGLLSGLSGDALRLLLQLQRPEPETINEEEIAGESNALLQFGYVLDRASLAAGLTPDSFDELLRADQQPIRAGLPVDAVFGALDAEALEAGLAATVAGAIAYRHETYEPPATPPTKLHAGVDLPVIDANLGGVFLGAGAILELATCDQGPGGDGFEVQTDRQVILDLHFGVQDGWLVGGPGAGQNDIEVRWVSARLYLPLAGSTRVSGARIVLHEANCFGVRRDQWVIENGAGVASPSLPTSEVHLILAEVVGRLAAASPDLSQLLADIGLVAGGGYDPEGFDQLILDASAAINAAIDASPASLAGALRALGGFGGAGAEISWALDAATIAVDLNSRAFALDVSHVAADLVPLGLTLFASASSASISGSIGAIEPDVGGLELVASAATGGVSPALTIAWQTPGSLSATSINLLSSLSTSEQATLVKLGASFIPSTLLAGLVDHLRETASDDARVAIEVIMDGLDLLAPPSELPSRRVLLPWALFMDPVGWLKAGAAPWKADPFGQAIQAFDAIGQLLIPGFTEGGFDFSNEVSVTYGVASDRLNVAVAIETSHSLGATPVIISLGGGLSIATNGSIGTLVSSSATFDGKGVAISLSPDVRIDLLRSAPAAPMQIYPSGPGLGSLLATGAGMAIPVALNALIAERANPTPSLQKNVAVAVFELGSALDLLESNQFADARIQTFAADPAGVLLSRLPNLVVTAISQLANALDPAGTVVSTSTPATGICRLSLGSTDPVEITLDASPTGPAIELAAALSIADVGTVGFDRVRLSASGVAVAVSYVASGFDVGNGLILRPVAKIEAGVSGTGFTRMAALGLVTDGTGDQSVQFRWALNQTPPRVVVVEESPSGETEDNEPAAVALALLSQAVSMAAGVTLEALGTLGTDAVDALQDVLFTGGTPTLDPTLFDDIVDPEALLKRLFQLGFNLADHNLKITIDGKVDVGFTRNGDLAGIFVSLPPGERISLGGSDPTVDLEVVANWVTSPGIAPGLSILLVEKVGSDFQLNAGFSIAGLGVRVGKNAGPLLNLGIMSIDAIGVHLYGEAVPAGLGGGVQVQLDGLAIVPSAAGGDNAVANNIMSDAGNDASPSARPAFSPALAIQKNPGGDLGISLRAGDPPGPWWLTIQRQLGPLYLEQFGFDVTEVDGSVTGISLLFDARVSLFGLTASVEELGLHWLGGDVFELTNWAVDLKGLGVSGDFSGLSIAGGLLKTDLDGQIGYVGMLMGRFGVYGLSLFGGYSDDKGLPSFFVFGAIQGPIGGPPAFFLTGIGGGLGIKRGLRVPDDLSKFGEYPFIKALDPAASVSSDPLEELRKLAEYFPPEPGNFWFAAGISFTSFSLVDGVAVLSVSVGNGLELNLFGLARMALPRPQAALVSIELGLLARFSSSEGLFLIQAQLTDNSWLLYPEVRLTGGFAFATWWLGPNAGQFVLTLGGYHPSFQRDGYPIVARLGLQWRVSNAIVIKGGSYFALTSEALMAGVEVEVSADFGFAWARIAFGANAIVYFDPFYFMADAYARISAGVKIKTFLGTIRISISLGARIEVEGPDFRGKATIEVGPCDIKVKFGSSREIRGIFVGWDEFVPKYLEETAPGRARTLSGAAGKGALPASTEGETSAPSSDGSYERPFEVFAEFEVSVVATGPVTRFDFNNPAIDKDITPKLPSGAAVAMGLSPMNAAGLKGELEIRLERRVGNTWTDRTSDLRPLVEGMKDEKTAEEGPTYGLEAFPIGVWGPPEDPEQPSSPIPKGDVIFAGSRLKMVAEADMSSQTGPEIDYYRVEAGRRPLPLSAAGTLRADNLNRATALGVVAESASIKEAFIEARKYLFADGTGALPEGLLATGQRSAKAQAIYENSRTAPPMFGTLMDGLEASNASNGSTAFMSLDESPRVIKPTKPFVTGFMSNGAGVALRDATTTVADKRIKRRPAPSTESVRGRLGRSLPIKLNTTHAPSSFNDLTVVVRGSVPRTSVTSASQTYLGGRVGSGAGAAYVKGLGTEAGPVPQAPGSKLRPGDIVTMRSPDAAIDGEDTRPELKITGAARVVMLLGNGAVVADEQVQDRQISVPKHTATIAVQASGGGDGRPTGLRIVGWHDQSRLIRLTGRSALGAGCVLSLNGTAGRASVGWHLAQDVVRGAAAVSTRFDHTVTCVGVILKAGEGRSASDVEIELHGARHRRQPVQPVVVQAGARSVLLFEINTIAGHSGVSVRALQGGAREIAGMIGANASAEAMAELIAEKGLPATVSRLRAVGGSNCEIEWVPAQED